ncbi:hypothetical protein [Deinococcus apachensis]|uniref:hypothetical protein n=1 Tax=Deinococcus apachensis TaxID=309886 RepID=UPI0003795BFD|nr:hypothetical protein [Deinococcus apachensis]
MGPSELGALVFVLLYGASNGAMTMARALLVGEVFGAERYGQVNGWIAMLVALGLALIGAAGLVRSVPGARVADGP